MAKQGSYAELCIEGEAVRILKLIPGDDRGLISAVETEAARRGLKEVICDIPKEESGIFSEDLKVICKFINNPYCFKNGSHPLCHCFFD